jgi:hypothetical protein
MWCVLDVTQGCQMVYAQTQNPHLGKFWRALDWKMLIYFMAIFNILRTFGIFLHDHLVHFVFIWYILSGLGIMYLATLDVSTFFNPAELKIRCCSVSALEL